MLIVVFAPSLWKRVETFALEPDYRMPHDLSNDYWLYERFAGLAADHYDTLLIGDSVVWGEYVTRQETLSHYLNELAGQERYANLGLDGAHPLALERPGRALRRQHHGQERPAPVQSAVDELAAGPTCRTTRRTSSIIPGWCRSSRRAFPAYKAGDLAAAGHPRGAAPAVQQLDDPPAAGLLRPDRHPRLDAGASLRQPAARR